MDADPIGTVVLQDLVGLIGTLIVTANGNQHFALADFVFVFPALGFRDAPVNQSAGNASGGRAREEAGYGTGCDERSDSGDYQGSGTGSQSGQAAQDAAGGHTVTYPARVGSHIQAAFLVTAFPALVFGQDGYFPVKAGPAQVFNGLFGHLFVAKDGNYCFRHAEILLWQIQIYFYYGLLPGRYADIIKTKDFRRGGCFCNTMF
ncbi:hypothetical protein MTY_1862 [Moorella thermoacetica Y72]|uniref:Uncharacterized protein n=1 Tax=Moorella thermoacetica Y72 TaxID=1325331 RepID=A0A0S6UC17_NEOTH|nr:hypothetical protein MTY_1862 [Moorella thermoacetica Y72]